MVAKPSLRAHPFALHGTVKPLVKATEGTVWTPTRPMGGWLATYGKIGPNGGVVPTKDREGQIFEAAKTLGMIDFGTYLKKGRWNDTHDEGIIVGVPTDLEFHDHTTDLAKAHRKVGFWTEGHLFDRTDPMSWELFGYEPTEKDLDRSDYFWKLSHLLKGTPRSLALSAHGKMLLSPCGERIIWATVRQAAVCEVPQNADATLQPLELAVKVRQSMVGANACATCSCPAGACKNLLRKGVTATAVAPIVQESLEGSASNSVMGQAERNEEMLQRLVTQVAKRMKCSEQQAREWVRKWIKARAAQQQREA
jgi:hypothetical protein